jgi:hypothetical protein
LRGNESQYAAEADELLGRILTLVEHWRGETQNRGLSVESSLAQGFKHSLWLRRDDAPSVGANPVHDRQIIALAKDGLFWYSRTIAVQALGLRIARGGSDHLLHEVVQAKQRDEHPYVTQAADLVLRGLNADKLYRYIWEDEFTVIQRSGHELDPAAAHLLGKIVLVINMMDQEDPDHPERRKAVERAVIKSQFSPLCLSDRSKYHLLDERQREDDTCPTECDLKLCPYRPSARADRIFRGEPHPVFCRRLERTARRGFRRLPRVANRASLGPRLSYEELLWRWMAERQE